MNMTDKWKKDLIKDIRFDDEVDNERDYPFGKWIGTKQQQGPEFSACNRKELARSFLSISQKCKVIVEIGVCKVPAPPTDDWESFLRRQPLFARGTSTYVFLNNKRDETLYLGIDLEDKTFLDDPYKNIHTLQTNSVNYDEVVNKLKELGVDTIDYLFIDGWHSINQVYKDWEYTSLLSETGIVGFHDTTVHPGPSMFTENLNPDIWDVQTYCPDDNGISFVTKKQQQ